LTKKILPYEFVGVSRKPRGVEIFFAKPGGLELARWLGA